MIGSQHAAHNVLKSLTQRTPDLRSALHYWCDKAFFGVISGHILREA
jgi:hypothetical protein